MRFKFYNKEYDSENIDYIKLAIEYNNSSKLYYFVVSENGNENIILESKTIDELEILDKYNNLENIKNELGFINAKNEFSVFINPYKAKQLEVKENLFKRN